MCHDGGVTVEEARAWLDRLWIDAPGARLRKEDEKKAVELAALDVEIDRVLAHLPAQVKTAHDMGITTPLPDTPSLPIGADAVKLIDHVGAYGTFPNLGMKVVPHAILELRTGDGKLVWRYDRDGPKPKRALPDHVAADMIKMMNSVVENGTGRRARLDGIAAAGKTGTTNAYRDAWFMGYTGNFVCGVWFGNDDYTIDQPHDGRLAAGDDLAQHHGLCAPGHRDQTIARRAGAAGATSSRPSPKSNRRPGRRRRGRPCSPGAAPTSSARVERMMDEPIAPWVRCPRRFPPARRNRPRSPRKAMLSPPLWRGMHSAAGTD